MVLARHRLGDAEVGDLHLAVGGDQDVARLDVAVHDAVAVRVAQRGGDLRGDLGRARRASASREPRKHVGRATCPSTNSMTMK